MEAVSRWQYYSLSVLLSFRPHFNPDAWKHREAAPEFVRMHRMNITMATIRVPVKLHNFLPSEAYSC